MGFGSRPCRCLRKAVTIGRDTHIPSIDGRDVRDVYKTSEGLFDRGFAHIRQIVPSSSKACEYIPFLLTKFPLRILNSNYIQGGWMDCYSIERFKEPLSRSFREEFPEEIPKVLVYTQVSCDRRIRNVAEKAFSCIIQGVFPNEIVKLREPIRLSASVKFKLFRACWAICRKEASCANVVFEVAWQCARKNALETIQHIQQFGFQNQRQLGDIIKRCLCYGKGSAIQYIPNSGLQQEVLAEVIQRCAEIDAAKTVDLIQTFGLTNQKALIDVAKTCARRDGVKTANGLQNFGIESREALSEIAEICAQSPLDPLTILNLPFL